MPKKTVYILSHEAKALLEIFCLSPSTVQLFFMDESRLVRTDELMIFEKFADQGWICFNFLD